MKKLPMDEIYKEKINGATYESLASKYSTSINTIRRRLDKYCKDKRVKTPYEVIYTNIYNDRVEFMSCKDIAKKYNIDQKTISRNLKKFCKEKNLLPFEEVQGKMFYDLVLNSNITIIELSDKYPLSYDTILSRIRMYCKKNDLLPPKEEQVKIMIEERKKGYTNQEVANRFNYDKKQSISKKVSSYCKKNNISLERSVTLSKKTRRLKLYNKDIYDKFKNGYSVVELSNYYSVSRQSIYNYIKKQSMIYLLSDLKQVLIQKEEKGKQKRK